MMGDYSFASEIKFVPKLSSRASQSEYYEWEDAMEDFLYDRGLESHMKIHFARRTFSECVSQWWIKLQQRHVDRGEDPCRTWSGMKKVLRRRYDPPNENTFSPKKTVAAGIHSSFDTKPMMRSSWIDSIVGDVYEPQQGATTKSDVAENRLLHGRKEKSYVAKRISPCNEHGKSAVVFPKYFSPIENRQKYATVRDVPKANILRGISSTPLKHVRSSSAAGHKGNFCLDEAKKRLHKLQEQIKQEKKEKNVAAEIFLSPKLNEEVHTNANELKDETPIEGLNLLVKKDDSSNNTADQKGQRWSVFQSECNIKDKVCKLVIDGGSFTNMISKDLVQALSLSTWRLPTPHHVKWMNPSGKLKITHKVRVNFSVGNYIDKVECDVVPMDVCHLLLGRPWEYDLNATHEGRSNYYSFVHKGVHHVLKPAQECAIMAEVFPAVTKTKASKIIPKTGTSLLQGGENDVVMSDPTIEICVCNDATIAAANVSESPINSFKSCANKFLSYVAEEKEETNIIADTNAIIGNNVHRNEATEHLLKPRTAFLEEGEDDEDMAHQTITAINSETKCHSRYISEGNAFEKKNIQFGSFSFVANHEKTSEVLSASHAMLCNVFVGSNIKKHENNRETRPYVKIGSMLVEIEEAKDHIQVAKTFPRAWHTFLSSSTRPQVNQITKLQYMEGSSQFGLVLCSQTGADEKYHNSLIRSPFEVNKYSLER